MQLRLPWDAEPGRRARALDVAGRAFPIEIVRHRRARRYVLRVTADGVLRLTVPRGASIAGGERFAERQAEWVAREWARLEARARPWGAGTRCWFRGEAVALEIVAGHATCGTERVVLSTSSRDSVRVSVESHLRRLAARELPERCLALAEAAGCRLTRVSVRNQRSRWGSCSPRGVIALNWRLVQMPPAVADYVIHHELAHLAHPNHSRRFWREVERLCPEWRAAERWLRRYGRELMP